MRNEMVHRPVVKKKLVKFMRTKQKQLLGELGKIEKEAHKADVPIIPHETVVFLQFLLGQLQPKNILEIGAAIGFSSSLMAQFVGETGKVTTIERMDTMIQKAKETYKRLNLQEKVHLLEGEADELLKELPANTYDFVFMDSAKSKYIVFLPEVLRVMKTNAVLMIDDVFQAGSVLDDIKDIPRGRRAIHYGLNKLLKTVLSHPDLTSTLLPLGDGILLITKEKDTIKL
ncbi:MAG: O-methyltransferase [Lactobacillales bacterium]|jgi:predicted O-methyltransferase YrrM|nr:O-methyltransferase [Lactobacillales bacterium]